MNEYAKGQVGCCGHVARPVLIALTACLYAAPALGRVEVSVTHIGFPTMRGEVVRSGLWVPVVVDLALVDQVAFDGAVRVGQFDNDGDECYDLVDVHLRAETGGTQRVWLYVPANTARGGGRFTCELLDQQGKAVEVLSQGVLAYGAGPAQLPILISDDDILILSLSTGAVGRVRDLIEPGELELFVRTPHVAHMSPLDLPEHWIGLEAVDYIVWDDARPEALTPRQLHALIEWVRQGGTLLIAASRSAGALKLTKSLDSVLPVDLGEVASVDNLRYLRERLLDAPQKERRARGEAEEWLDTGFASAIPVVRCRLRSGAVRIPDRDDNDSTVLTRRREGRGHVIFSAVVLKDLFSAPGGGVGFFRKVLHLGRLADETETQPDRVPLFSSVVSAVSFSTRAGVYLFIAGASSVGYVLLATFGTWAFLRGGGRRRHSWTAFALASVAASVVTVLVINSLQGFGESLHQVSVIDADAGSAYGMGTVFFGLKTSSDTSLDLWLPSSALGATEPGATDCFLRPLPDSGDWRATGTSFADPRMYRLVPAGAVIEDVAIRATLKQFEGRWQGSMGGFLDGKIVVRGRHVAEGSFIVNELGVDLNPCYLLHSLLDLDSFEGARDEGSYVYDIGPVYSDGRRVSLRPRCYRPAPGETIDDVVSRSKLALRQKEWAAKFGGMLADFGLGSQAGGIPLGDEKTALLLLSTVGDFDPASMPGAAGPYRGSRTFSRMHVRQLDLREHIYPGKLDDAGTEIHAGTAIVIGFAADPGPVRLFLREGTRDFRPLEPDARKSWTMYRIRVPVTHIKGGGEVRDQDGGDGITGENAP